MGLNFLQQLLTVACLAFASGLLAGVAVLRGELGDLRGPRRAPAAAAAASGPRRRKRPKLTWDQAVRAVTTAVSDLDPALKWVLISLVVMLSASAVITRLIE